jgi:hypothetical protein
MRRRGQDKVMAMMEVGTGTTTIGLDGPTQRTLRASDNVPGSPARLYAIWNEYQRGGAQTRRSAAEWQWFGL